MSIFKNLNLIFFLNKAQNLDLKCLNDKNTLNYQIVCSLNAYTKSSSDQLKINFNGNIQSFIQINSSMALKISF